MDPMMFGIDGEKAFEAVGVIVLLSFVIERSLSLLFEWELIIDFFDRAPIKEPIAFIVSFLVCRIYHFDALAIILNEPSATFWGYLITAGVVAGGSKGSVKLFRDLLGAKSRAQEDKDKKHSIIDGH